MVITYLTLIYFLIAIILGSAYFIPQIIVKVFSKHEFEKAIKISSNYKDMQNFIEIKKNEFSTFDRYLVFMITIASAVLIGVNLESIEFSIAQLFLGISVIACLSIYINTRKLNQRIIRNLYIIKDKNQ